MADIKQVVVVRKDLNMPSGLIAAQVAHASSKVIFDRMRHHTENFYETDFTWEMKHWMEGHPTIAILWCNSEEELYSLAKMAVNYKIPSAIFIDDIFGKKVSSCIALGPDISAKIDVLTIGLKLV